jgi:hypothetical protein
MQLSPDTEDISLPLVEEDPRKDVSREASTVDPTDVHGFIPVRVGGHKALVRNFNRDDIKWAAVWKTLIQSLIGTLEAMLIMGYVMTWAYLFAVDNISLFYTLMQLLLIPAMIFALIIIPVMYGQMFEQGILNIDETKIGKRGYKGAKLILAYIIIEILNALLAAICIVVRVFMEFPLSIVPNVRMLHLSLFILTCITLVVALGGLFFAIALRSRLVRMATANCIVKTGETEYAGVRTDVYQLCAKSESKHANRSAQNRQDAYKFYHKKQTEMSSATCHEPSRLEVDNQPAASRDFMPVDLWRLEKEEKWY